MDEHDENTKMVEYKQTINHSLNISPILFAFLDVFSSRTNANSCWSFSLRSFSAYARSGDDVSVDDTSNKFYSV